MQEGMATGLLAVTAALLLPLGGPALAAILRAIVGANPRDRGAIPAVGRAILMGAVALNYGAAGVVPPSEVPNLSGPND